MIVERLRTSIACISIDILELMTNMSNILKSIGKMLEIEESIFVSDLSKCVLKILHVRALVRKLGIEKCRELLVTKMLRMDTIDRICMGFLVQYGLEKLMENIGMRKPQETVRRVLDVDGINVVISGKPDYEITIDSTVIPLEVKYTSKSIDKPRPTYVTQCSFYAWLYRAPYCKLIIFTPDRAHEHDIPTINDDFAREYLRKWVRTAPYWSNECDRCYFSENCSERFRKMLENATSFRKCIKTLKKIEKILTR